MTEAERSLLLLLAHIEERRQIDEVSGDSCGLAWDIGTLRLQVIAESGEPDRG